MREYEQNSQEPLSEIASRFGVSLGTVYCAVKRAGKCLTRVSNGVSGRLRTSERASGQKHYRWKGAGEICGKYFQQARRGARLRGLEFKVSPDFCWSLFLKQNRRCALSGRDLQTNPMTASLDRKDSSLGYTEDNVQWLHKDVNVAKLDKTDSEFVRMCCEVADCQRLSSPPTYPAIRTTTASQGCPQNPSAAISITVPQ